MQSLPLMWHPVWWRYTPAAAIQNWKLSEADYAGDLGLATTRRAITTSSR